MCNYQIVTDSCCDFTREQYKKLKLVWVPLTLRYKGAEMDSLTEPAELHDFYDGVRSGEMPTTSAVNPDAWERAMEGALKEGRDVLCLAFTGALSTTYQSAVIAANELREKYPERKIIVVDTLCAALGQGLLVWHACRKRSMARIIFSLSSAQVVSLMLRRRPLISSSISRGVMGCASCTPCGCIWCGGRSL